MTKLKLDLWDENTSGCLRVLSPDHTEVVSEVWEGPSQAARGTLGPNLKILFSIESPASEAAAHGSETRLSCATSSPLILRCRPPWSAPRIGTLCTRRS